MNLQKPRNKDNDCVRCGMPPGACSHDQKSCETCHWYVPPGGESGGACNNSRAHNFPYLKCQVKGNWKYWKEA